MGWPGIRTAPAAGQTSARGNATRVRARAARVAAMAGAASSAEEVTRGGAPRSPASAAAGDGLRRRRPAPLPARRHAVESGTADPPRATRETAPTPATVSVRVRRRARAATGVAVGARGHCP
eukprot:6977603-Alexandrium_andersonii.AAC.1